MSHQGAWNDERGFTLLEALIVVAVVGIAVGIATSTWSGAIESQRVALATNRIVADLRSANTNATNELHTWEVDLTSNISTSSKGPTGSPSSRDLDDNANPAIHEVVANTTVAITFHPDGSASMDPAGTNTFEIMSSQDASKCQAIQIAETTSRVKIVAC